MARVLGKIDGVGGGRVLGKIGDDFSSQIMNQTAEKSFGQKTAGVLDSVAGFGKGFQKGMGSTLYGAASLGGKIADVFLPGTPISEQIGAKPEALEPEGGAEKFGYGTEQLLELFMPAGGVSRANRAINLFSEGLKIPKVLQGATRVALKGLTEAGVTGGIRAAQTDDVGEGIKAGTTAGVLSAGFALIGEGAKALRLPERLYSQIYKNTYADALNDLKTGGLVNLQQKNPEKFQELINNGIIKLKGGQPVLNETLAKEALDRGLRGSVRGMANEVVEKSLDYENEARALARNAKDLITFKEKQFINVLQEVADDYKNVGLGEVSRDAQYFANVLKEGKGKLNAYDTLMLKRFLDGMRYFSSGQAVTPGKLSVTQQNFKTLSDIARTRLKEAVPAMVNTLNEQRFYIEAMEALAQEAKRTGNRQVISLLDSVFLSGGMASSEPVSAGALILLRRYLGSPRGATALGQMIQNPSTNRLGIALRSLFGTGVQEITEQPNLRDKVVSSGFDYDRMVEDGITDEQIMEALQENGY